MVHKNKIVLLKKYTWLAGGLTDGGLWPTFLYFDFFFGGVFLTDLPEWTVACFLFCFFIEILEMVRFVLEESTVSWEGALAVCGVEEVGVWDLVLEPIFFLGVKGVEQPTFFFGGATLELGESTATVEEVAVLDLVERLTLEPIF